MGTPNPSKEIGIQVRQSQPCRRHQQRFIKEPMVMHLLWCLWFFSAFFEASLKASHIPGVANTAADMISRNRSTEFLSSHPHMAQASTPIPLPLLKLMSPQKCDWTSPTFVHHFRDTITMLKKISANHR